MRENDTLYFTLRDHLGSISVIADASGGIVSEIRYDPFGGTRYTSHPLPTDYCYTGQREHAEIGLYFYNARWYDPSLGHFVQADSIVPGAGNPMGWDRYAYVFNSPTNLIDPSGHCAGTPEDNPICWNLLNQIENDYGVNIDTENYGKPGVEEWTVDQLVVLLQAFGQLTEEIGTEAFLAIYSGVTFRLTRDLATGAGGGYFYPEGGDPLGGSSVVLLDPDELKDSNTIGFDPVEIVQHEMLHHMDYWVSNVGWPEVNDTGDPYWFSDNAYKYEVGNLNACPECVDYYDWADWYESNERNPALALELPYENFAYAATDYLHNKDRHQGPIPTSWTYTQVFLQIASNIGSAFYIR